MVVGRADERDYEPQRGDPIWLDFDPQAGREQAGRRAAVVLSAGSYNGRTGLAIVCPITRQSKGYPFEVAIDEGLKVQGVVLADHVRSVDWRQRRAEYICTLSDAVVERIRGTIQRVIDG